jgi:hypothetical protein
MGDGFTDQFMRARQYRGQGSPFHAGSSATCVKVITKSEF